VTVAARTNSQNSRSGTTPENQANDQTPALIGGYTRGLSPLIGDVASPLAYSSPALRHGVSAGRPAGEPRTASAAVHGLRDRQLSRRKTERFGMGPAVVLGQHLADLAWPVGDSAVADPAARDRQIGNSHRKAAGT
jgi:hypothetical protein